MCVLVSHFILLSIHAAKTPAVLVQGTNANFVRVNVPKALLHITQQFNFTFYMTDINQMEEGKTETKHYSFLYWAMRLKLQSIETEPSRTAKSGHYVVIFISQPSYVYFKMSKIRTCSLTCMRTKFEDFMPKDIYIH